MNRREFMMAASAAAAVTWLPLLAGAAAAQLPAKRPVPRLMGLRQFTLDLGPEPDQRF